MEINGEDTFCDMCPRKDGWGEENLECIYNNCVYCFEKKMIKGW
jgi:hypothetical protein